MRRYIALAAFLGAIAALVIAGLDAPRSGLIAPVIAAEPSPVVSVTTLPALPSPHPAPRTPTPTQAPTATPATAIPATPTPAQPTQPPNLPAMPAGTVINVGGLVSAPSVITLKDMQKMAHTTLTLRVQDSDGRHRFHIFTGVLLRDLINGAHPNVPGGTNNSMDAYALVEGLGGGPAIVGFPEFEQPFNAKQVLIAYYVDGRPLSTPGIAELVIPEDATQGRFVTGISSITVGEPPR